MEILVDYRGLLKLGGQTARVLGKNGRTGMLHAGFKGPPHVPYVCDMPVKVGERLRVFDNGTAGNSMLYRVTSR
jgi:hypothetical protein